MNTYPRPLHPVSPCISVCKIDPVTNICLGCERTLDEISRWSSMDDVEKDRIWQRLRKYADGKAASDEK